MDSKTNALYRDLEALEFEGSSTDGAVSITVNGRQRPTALKLSETASEASLAAAVLEAHSKAAEAPSRSDERSVQISKAREIVAASAHTTISASEGKHLML